MTLGLILPPVTITNGVLGFNREEKTASEGVNVVDARFMGCSNVLLVITVYFDDHVPNECKQQPTAKKIYK